MVEARIDEGQAEHLPPEDAGEFGVAFPTAAESGPGQDDPADHGEVTLPVVDPVRHVSVEPVAFEPVLESLGLRSAPGIRDGGDVRPAAEAEPAVGGEHHVGKSRDRIEQRHCVSQQAVVVAQILPLPHCERRVGRGAGVHERVDWVVGREVVGRAHEEVADGCGAHPMRRGLRSRRGIRHGPPHKSTLESPARRTSSVLT